MAKIEPVTTYSAIVGSVLERERIIRNMTQSDVADAVRIGTSTWSRIEKGESSLSVSQLRAAAKILGLTPSEILDKVETAKDFVSKSGIRIIDSGRIMASGIIGTTKGTFFPVVGSALGRIIEAVIDAGPSALRKKSIENDDQEKRLPQPPEIDPFVD